MIDGERDPLEGFGFEESGDAWLERLREAQRTPALGSIGPYELVGEPTRGAQGVVYRARQPGTHRDVAIKRLIAGSFASPQARRRFELEIEAAATLDHQNVVRIFGVDSVDGEPILAMQWIDGVPVTEWASPSGGKRRATRDILRVFVAICEGVHHAHQRGVIHRDLKPSNVLVDDADVPHVLDFGLAKLVAPDARAALTATSGFAGTPAYASPEQLVGDAATIDLRTDVYSLGVILFELLTGRLPHDNANDITATLRAIERDEAPSASRFARWIDRELDTILRKALSRDRERRYASVDALAEDVRRYQRGEPILAAPPSAWYQFARFARRNRAAVATLVLIFALLSALALTQARSLAHITAARDQARRESAKAGSVLEFMKDELLAAASPARLGPDATLRDTLKHVRGQVDRRFEGQPGVQAEIFGVLGNSHAQIGEVLVAEQLLRDALALQERAEGVPAERRVAMLLDLADVLVHRGHLAEAESYVERAVALRDAATESAEARVRVHRLRARLALATARHAEARRIAEGLCAVASPEARDLQLLGTILHEGGDFQGGAAKLAEAIDAYRSAGPSGELDLAGALLCQSHLQYEVGDFEAALGSADLAHAIRSRAYGASHFLIAHALFARVAPLIALDRFDEARRDVELGHQIIQAAYVARDPAVAECAIALAQVVLRTGDLDLADLLTRESLEILETSWGESHPCVVSAMVVRAHVLRGRGELREAERLVRRALELRREFAGADHPDVAEALNELGLVLRSAGDFAGARRALLESRDILLRRFGERHPRTITLAYNLGQTIDAQGVSLNDSSYYIEAARHFRAALDAAREFYAPGHLEQRYAFTCYMGDLVFTGRVGEAEELCCDMIAEWETALGSGHAAVGSLRGWLGVIYRDTRRFDEAERALQLSIDTLTAARGARDPEAEEFRGALYTTHVRAGALEKAERAWSQLEPDTQSRFAEIRAFQTRGETGE